MNDREMKAHAAELQRQSIDIDGHSDILIAVTDGIAPLGKKMRLPDPATWEAPANVVELARKFGLFSPHDLYFGSGGNFIRVFEQGWKPA